MEINRGDIVYINGGRQIVVCGSCLSDSYNDMLERLPVEACLTDPPYGIELLRGTKALGTGGNQYKKIHGDKSIELFKQFYEKRVLGHAIDKFIVFGGNYFAGVLPPQKGWITWVKHNSDGLSFAKSELIYTNLNINAEVINYRWCGNSIEAGEKDIGAPRVHAAQKPVGLMAKLVDMAEVGDGYVLDGFGGSCSLLFAAEMCGKRSVIFELEPEYVEKALDAYVQRYPEQSIEKI